MRKGFVALVLVPLGLIVAGCVFAEASDSMSDSTDCVAWVDSLRNEGLAMARYDVLALARDPLLAGSPLPDSSQRYSELLQAIERKRNELADRYRAAASGVERDRVVDEADVYIEVVVADLLFPSWLGVGRGFFGVPGRIPRLDRPVACGHFVQKLLKDAGFNTQKRAGTWLAYLAPRDLLQSVGGYVPEDVPAWDGISARLAEQGAGLYLVGLECGWGHVGLLRRESGGNLWFLHSGPHFRGASVSMDDGERYLRQFIEWQHVWMVEFDADIVVKWLEGTVIVPCVVME